MSCALCHEDRNLCRSHIIPEFTYSPLYDANHRFTEVTDAKNGIVIKGQKGHWERLLCSECEQLLNVFERHSRRLFVDPLPQTVAGSKRIREHPRLDYASFKLFCLSILWRASVSSLPLFRHVSLGPHEDIIRRMLLNSDPGDTLDYPVQLFALHFEGEHFRDFMVEPTHNKVAGRRCYRFVFMGFVIFIYVAKHPLPEKKKNLVIRRDSVLCSFAAELGEFPFLVEVWETVRTTTKGK